MSKYVRLSVRLALMALLTTGCLPESEPDKPALPTTMPGRTPETSPAPTPASTAPTPSPTPGPAPTPAPTPGTTPNPTPGTVPKSATTAGLEPNVIKGVVRDEQGDPVPGARIRIAGYTGNPTGLPGADHDDDVTTDGAGAYRVQVPSGLYEVAGEATVAFEGKNFVFYLHPADGSCEPQMSAGGIVKHFVLRLSGLEKCAGDGVDPQHEGFYSGAPIELFHESPKGLPGDAQLTFTLTPTGPLADGGAGKVITMTRSVSALGNASGALETTKILHDIPLGRYQLTGFATLPGGARQDLAFGSFWAPKSAPAASYAVSFEPVAMGRGIRITSVSVYESGGGASAPTPTPTPTPIPEPTTTTTTTGQVCGEYWGCV